MMAGCEIRCEDSKAIGLFNRKLTKTMYKAIEVANRKEFTIRLWFGVHLAKDIKR